MSGTGIVVEVAREATPELLAALRSLLPQLSEHVAALDRDDVAAILAAPGLTVLVARDDAGTIVGTATLVTFRTLDGHHGRIEDVVVERAARGRGVGAALTTEALRHAAELDVEIVELTTSPRREAANRLYQRLGFQRRVTNVYQYFIRR